MRMHQIKIVHIFVPNLRQIYQFSNKKSFCSETKAHLGPWQLKKVILGLKTAFIWCTFGIERVNTVPTDGNLCSYHLIWSNKKISWSFCH